MNTILLLTIAMSSQILVEPTPQEKWALERAAERAEVRRLQKEEAEKAGEELFQPPSSPSPAYQAAKIQEEMRLQWVKRYRFELSFRHANSRRRNMNNPSNPVYSTPSIHEQYLNRAMQMQSYYGMPHSGYYGYGR